MEEEISVSQTVGLRTEEPRSFRNSTVKRISELLRQLNLDVSHDPQILAGTLSETHFK